MPPCSGRSRPSLAVAANAASLDRPCARRLRDRWPGRKNGPRRSRTKEWTYAISAIISVVKKSLVHLIRRAQVFPMLGREVVERQQRVSIFAQAVGRLLVFQRVALDEGVERQLGCGLGFGHPDLLQRAFGFRVLALRQLGKYVGGLVHPAALLARFRPDLTGGLPEP